MNKLIPPEGEPRYCPGCKTETVQVLRLRFERQHYGAAKPARQYTAAVCMTCGFERETLPDPAPGRVLPRQGRGE